MTRILLIRHAHSVANDRGILAGRSAGVILTEHGSKQASDLAERLKGVAIAKIHISPLERCHLTINPLLKKIPVKNRPKIVITEDLSEVDYGKWTGKKLVSLYRHKLWKVVQNRPSAMYFPDGEGLANVQVRAMRAVHTAANESGLQIIVSHGDVIKSIVAAVLGTHMDNFQKIVIEPASITVLDFDGSNFRILTLNNTSAPIAELAKIDGKRRPARALLGGGVGRKRK
ncbi:MSMEG_4193 family putative phosphomutase [Actinobacteria bacterium IMCC26103]|nr:MSMEG_4193 family putative phosphomutase [Actinobacteria bacterium IMCC26103]